MSSLAPAPKSHQLWQTGGLLQAFEWQAGPGTLKLWDGSRAEVHDGDRVMVFQRGLPAVSFVAVNRP